MKSSLIYYSTYNMKKLKIILLILPLEYFVYYGQFKPTLDYVTHSFFMFRHSDFYYVYSKNVFL